MSWLADHYVVDHTDEVIGLIVTKNLRINSECWWAFGRELALTDKEQLDSGKLSQWISILLACAPDYAEPHLLEWLATRCGKEGNIALATELFLSMGSCRLTIKSSYPREGEEHASRFDVSTPLRSQHFEFNEVWQNQLKPNLAAIAPSLLSGVVGKMEEIHRIRSPWNKDEHDWGDPTWGRSAIEPHEQDNYPEAIDVLIDAARDTLEWLAGHQYILFESWVERLIASDAPLLRRLAIHALTVHPNKSPDEVLTWLLTRLGLHALGERHEVYRAAFLNYPKSSGPVRKTVIQAMADHKVRDAVSLASLSNVARRQLPVLGRNTSRTQQEVQRPLLTVDECLRMAGPVKRMKDGRGVIEEAGDVIIYVAGLPAIYRRQPLYFQDAIFQVLLRIRTPVAWRVAIAGIALLTVGFISSALGLRVNTTNGIPGRTLPDYRRALSLRAST